MMKTMLVFSFYAFATLLLGEAFDLIVGDTYDAHLIHKEKAVFKNIPFIIRTEKISYMDPEQRIIKAVIARDGDGSNNTVTIAGGGVGFSYVMVKLKSERGRGLNYKIELYA